MEINMSGKAKMSVKTKRTILILGIIFGTIILFVASMAASIYFIIHPIKVVAPDNGEAAAENQKLKIQIQSLEDEIEHLNATTDRNSSNINPPPPVEIPTITTPDGKDEKSENDNVKGKEDGKDDDDDFSPSTVVTPEGGYEPEPEVDITIIDITE